jgi:hypothetical protein
MPNVAEIEFRPLGEMVQEAEAGARDRIRNGWGNWHFDPGSLQLIYKEAGRSEAYWIDLEEMHGPGRVLDWIVQLSHKTWHTPQDLSDLVRALDDLFYLQANVCSHGRDMQVKEPRRLLAEALQITSRRPA